MCGQEDQQAQTTLWSKDLLTCPKNNDSPPNGIQLVSYLQNTSLVVHYELTLKNKSFDSLLTSTITLKYTLYILQYSLSNVIREVTAQIVENIQYSKHEIRIQSHTHTLVTTTAKQGQPRKLASEARPTWGPLERQPVAEEDQTSSRIIQRKRVDTGFFPSLPGPTQAPTTTQRCFTISNNWNICSNQK